MKDIYLSNNGIVDLSFLNDLIKIEVLKISGNNIENIGSIFHLLNKDEIYIDIRSNNIKEIPRWLVESKIDFLGIEKISITDQMEEGVLKNIRLRDLTVEGINITDNPIENVPKQILNLGKEAIKDYFDSISENAKPINEIKVILLGEGGAGKTSLMRFLQGEEYQKGQSQTHGINLEELRENDINIKVWDFGGQDIMHHTHQFFLTQNSVYVLVLNAREEQDVEKWLKLIEIFGGDSPVIIVTNKIDENPSSHENIRYLSSKYKNLNNRYCKLSCESGEGLSEFKDLLIDTILGLGHIKTLWGQNWLNVKNEIERMRIKEIKDYIGYDKYEELCEQNNVSKLHCDTLINWLNELGVITYFSDRNLSETNVINPSWLTEAFYGIINARIIADNFGKFNISHLSTILNSDKYPIRKYNYLIDLMIKFELCYKIDSDNFLIPDLLKKEEPDFEFKMDKSLQYKIKYLKLLPKSIFPQFMVRRHLEIKNECRWRTGILLENKYYGAHALIRVDEDDKEISIFVNGDDKRGYLASIVNDLETLNNIYTGLERELLIPCCCETCKESKAPYFHKVEVLKRFRSKGKNSCDCQISTDEVPIRDLLGILISPEEVHQKVSEYAGLSIVKIKSSLDEGNISNFIDDIKSLYSSVSYLLHEKTEKSYHTPLFILLRSIYSSNVRADEVQAKGRADIIIDLPKHVYILELKLDGSADKALSQIHEQKYYEPYKLSNKKITLLGINFDSSTRNIQDYKIEEL